MPPNYLALALYQAVALSSVKRVLCLVLSVEKTGLSPNTFFKYMMMSFLVCFLPSPKSCPIPEKQDGRSLASLSQTQPLSPKSLILCMVSGCPVFETWPRPEILSLFSQPSFPAWTPPPFWRVFFLSILYYIKKSSYPSPKTNSVYQGHEATFCNPLRQIKPYCSAFVYLRRLC